MSDSTDPIEVFEIDEQGEAVPVRERSEGELDDLRDQMQMGRGARYGGYQYVAEPVPGFDQPGIWTCHFATTKSGYAHVGHGLSWAIAETLGLPMELIPHRSLRGLVIDDVPADRRDDVIRWRKGAVGIGRVLIVTLPPKPAAMMNDPVVPDLPGGVAVPVEQRGDEQRTKVVCYTTHECDRVSPHAAEICNPGPDRGGFSKIWVKSPFAYRSFVEGGVRSDRLRLVIPPLIGGPWQLREVPADGQPRPPYLKDGVPFTFGMIGTWIERKGFADLLRAYYRAFGSEDHVLLDLRTSALEEYETVEAMETACREQAAAVREELGIRGAHKARVRITVGTAETDQGIIDWLTNLDCFANSSYGEGLGVPQIYALAAGVPMITSGFGAVGDLVADLIAGGAVEHQLLDFDLEPISKDMRRISRMYDPTQRWGRYRVEDFSAAMWRAYDAAVRRGAVHRREEVGAAIVRDRYSFERCAPAIGEALSELVDLSEFS